MYVFFNSRDELQRIEVSKIVYFEADGNYTDIVMVNKLRASVCMNLGEMERTLAAQTGEEGSHFMRIGKRFIINMDYVYSINVLKQQLILSDYDHFAFQVSISKDALRRMKELMLKMPYNESNKMHE
jgi:DNA-binding LytR/AlgR family response regulator